MIQFKRNLILIFIFFERGRTINEIKFLHKNNQLQGSPPSLVGSAAKMVIIGEPLKRPSFFHDAKYGVITFIIASDEGLDVLRGLPRVVLFIKAGPLDLIVESR